VSALVICADETNDHAFWAQDGVRINDARKPLPARYDPWRRHSKPAQPDDGLPSLSIQMLNTSSSLSGQAPEVDTGNVHAACEQS
jgi:hypothetical protein